MGESCSLGILLAGGRSRRFGEPKAGALLDGRPLAEIALRKLEATTPRVGIVAAVAGEVPGWTPPPGIEIRGDTPPGVGPLGGISAGLAWAGELGCDGILVLPVDVPGVPEGLLRALLQLGAADRAVVPESRGPRGFEPLCAWYGVGLGEEVDREIRSGGRTPAALLARVPLARLSLAEVSAFGDPDALFHNVNAPADLPSAPATGLPTAGAGGAGRPGGGNAS